MGIKKTMNSARITENYVPKRSTLSLEHVLSLDGLLKFTRKDRGLENIPYLPFSLDFTMKLSSGWELAKVDCTGRVGPPSQRI